MSFSAPTVPSRSPDGSRSSAYRRLARRSGSMRRSTTRARDRNELCPVQILTDIYFPGLAGVSPDPGSLPATHGAWRSLQMDPRNVTLEPEYYKDDRPGAVRAQEAAAVVLGDVRPKRAGREHRVGHPVPPHPREARLRELRQGTSKPSPTCASRSATTSNVGDGVVIHRHVLLDDRGRHRHRGRVVGGRLRQRVLALAQHRRRAHRLHCRGR